MVTGAPITVLTGEVGVGKTTLLRHLLEHVPKDLTVGLLSNAQANRGDLLRWVLNAFDLPAPAADEPVAMFQQFQDFVIEEYGLGRRVVIIIDEAQNLGEERLEELRMLTNINSGRDELLQLILVGQPQLRAILRTPDLRQFAQRVSVYFHLTPFGYPASRNYVRHRLKHAGGTGSEFTAGAIRAIHEQAEGIPRVINKLSDLSLVYAASDGRRTVTKKTVENVLADGLLLEVGLDSMEDEGAAYDAMEMPHRDAAE